MRSIAEGVRGSFRAKTLALPGMHLIRPHGASALPHRLAGGRFAGGIADRTKVAWACEGFRSRNNAGSDYAAGQQAVPDSRSANP